MVLLNSRITWLQETHPKYQFANAFLDRIVQKLDYQGLRVRASFKFLMRLGICLN